MNKEKIGVGVITTGIRKIRDYKLPEGADFFIFTDKEKKGPGYARNKVLQHFEGYDYVFLFDDDTYPTKAGWVEYFIDEYKRTKVNFMAYPSIFTDDPHQVSGDMYSWKTGLGCFTFQTKLALEIVGGYNTDYKGYGYEDAARNNAMINKAKLSGEPGFNSFPLKGVFYIHSEDVYHENPEPNLTQEQKEKGIACNWPIYLQDIASDRIYYDFREET